jgi:antitoxin HicB
MSNKHKGSTFDSFLKEEGLLEEAEATAIKRVIAYQLEQVMEKKHLTKSEVAGKMRTSRSALERLLDPKNTSITLYTLVKLARVLGKKLKLSFA